ncbi:hypothetical protein N0V83_004190 [Neocucurbitaria cava]|uniref:Uncharacterized protein n=1 Tax=Neocucurbitaria cava TaxID=798079 RepID=A0A9W8YAC1_9PLEO|nr:hypothetical protein N0V83_004190 [Neocucurbitaria cava]
METVPENNLNRLTSKMTRAAIYLRNKKESRLLRLPGEIRNQIYEYIFRGHTLYLCQKTFDAPPDMQKQKKTMIHYKRERLALLETCRQICAEARLLPFKLNGIAGSFETMSRAITHGLRRGQANALTTMDMTFAKGTTDRNLDARSILWVVGGLTGLKQLTIRYVEKEPCAEWEQKLKMQVIELIKSRKFAIKGDVELVLKWKEDKFDPYVQCWHCRYEEKIREIKRLMRLKRKSEEMESE